MNLVHEWGRISSSAKTFAARAALIASTGGLLFGYDIGVVEGALPQLRDSMNLDLDQQDMVVSVMVVGAIAGICTAPLSSCESWELIFYYCFSENSSAAQVFCNRHSLFFF